MVKPGPTVPFSVVACARPKAAATSASDKAPAPTITSSFRDIECPLCWGLPTILRRCRSGGLREETRRAGSLELRSPGELRVERVGERSHRRALELPDALARQAELLADRLEGGSLAVEAEAQLEDPALALGELLERAAHFQPPHRVRGLVGRVASGRIAEQIAELSAVGVVADALVERHRRVGGVQRLVDVLEREARSLGQLRPRRRPPELRLELRRSPTELQPALVDMRRHADRRRLVRDGALARLPDPPGGVGRELVAPAPVELLDGAVQPDHALLDEIAERQPMALVALRDRDHQAEVGIDHPL